MGSGLYLLVCEGQVRNFLCVRATGGGSGQHFLVCEGN